MTGGRLKRLKKYLKDETFLLTYGDGLSNVDLRKLVRFHNKKKKLVTLTAVRPPARFGEIIIKKNIVSSFKEKPQTSDSWINGGFFVLDPSVMDFIEGDHTIWERDPLVNLSKVRELTAFRHKGFWQPMDNLRDKNKLEELWNKEEAPWKIWD